MRSFTYVTVLATCVLVASKPGQGQTPGGAPPGGASPPPNCDGTSAKWDKCNYSIPTGYREAADCEGDLPGEGSCLHMIAFSSNYFYCTAPEKDMSKSPPSYTSFCTDNIAQSVECTNTRTCAGTLIVDDSGQKHTRCAIVPDSLKVTYRTLKYNRTPAGSGNSNCTETVPLP
jgi:hypothetical protein